MCGDNYCCSYSLVFPLSARTIFRILESREMYIIVSVIRSIQKIQLSKLHQEHYKSSFLIIVICHWLSLFSELSVNYVRCSSLTAYCYATHDFYICAIHISMTLFPFPLVAQNLRLFPRDSLGNARKSHFHENSHFQAHL